MADLDITRLDWADRARFWSKVATGKFAQCWNWQGTKDALGYGSVKLFGSTHPAHRIAYAIASGELPPEKVVRHRCDNPSCCNPTHLVVGTHADNVADRVRRRRSAHGERSGRAKLTEADVLEILASPNNSLRILALQYGVSTHTIQAIRYRRSWKHVVPPAGIEPASDDYESSVLPFNYGGQNPAHKNVNDCSGDVFPEKLRITKPRQQ